MEELLFCNQTVGGSNPSAGSSIMKLLTFSLLTLLCACTASFTVSTVQELPKYTTESLPISAKQDIIRGHTNFPDWLKLRNSAWFVVVSRDRVRLHVKFAHPWESVANPASWKATMYVDGRKVSTTRGDLRTLKPIYYSIDTNRHRVVRDHNGDAVWVDPMPMGYNHKAHYDSWSGSGSFTFYETDILTGAEEVRFVLKHRLTTYSFTWKLHE